MADPYLEQTVVCPTCHAFFSFDGYVCCHTCRDSMDADVEPEPCRDCMTPIPPGWGWCAECERKRKQEFCPWCHLPYDDPPGMGCQLPHD